MNILTKELADSDLEESQSWWIPLREQTTSDFRSLDIYQYTKGLGPAVFWEVSEVLEVVLEQ